MKRFTPLTTCLLLFVLVVAFPFQAWARELGVEIAIGATTPLGAHERLAVVFAEEQGVPGTRSSGSPELHNRYLGAGTHLALRVFASGLEFGYANFATDVRAQRRRCTGDRLAYRLPDGEVEDQAVVYSCSRLAERETAAQAGGAPVVYHFLSGGLRELLGETDEDRAIQSYLSGGGIVGFTRSDYRTGVSKTRVGAGLYGSIGLAFPLSGRFEIFSEGRYRFLWMGRSDDISRVSTRTSGRRVSLLGVLGDHQHFLEGSAGLRLRF